MIVTIDGPAGSGKSTAARKLAARLEVAYLDTGAMYRAIALAAKQRGVDFRDKQKLLDVAASIKMEVDCGPTHTRVRLDGHDVSEAIRSLEVSGVTPYVARHDEIRTLLVTRQRQIGLALGSLVTEGRDQGSVVFPDADVKFVLQATLEARVQRRLQELLADGEEVSPEEVADNLRSRDEVDAVQWEPLLSSNSAHLIDTTGLSISEVIDQMAQIIGEPEI